MLNFSISIIILDAFCSYNDKITAAVELSYRDTSAKVVSKETGVSTATLYAWKRQLIPESESVTVKTTNSDMS